MRKIILLSVLIGLHIIVSAQIRIKAVGDIMMGSYTPTKIIPPNNGIQYVDSIASYLDSADILFGNLEGVFVTSDLKPQKCSSRSRKAKKCYEFGMPDTLAYTLEKLHFDVVSMDNNHNSDYGYEGVKHTKKVLDKVGINYAAKKAPTVLKYGYAEDSVSIVKDSILLDSIWCNRTTTVLIEKVDSVEIAFVAFGHSSISYHVGDLKNTKAVVEQLSAKYDIVVVSFHGGAEGLDAQHVVDKTESYYGENRGNIYQFAHTAIDAGADLVIGHGPHVLRAVELYKDKFICYSLGNFLTYGNVNITGRKGYGAIMDLQIDRKNGNFMAGSIIPTIQVGNGIPTYDENYNAVKTIIELTKSDFPKGNLMIENNGTISKKVN